MKTPSSWSVVWSICFGLIIWLLSFTNFIPYSFFELSHVQSLLIAAPLWIIPLALYIDQQSSLTRWLALAAALLFTLSYQLEKGYLAAALILPWFVFVAFLGIRALRSVSLPITVLRATKLSAYLYLPVGAAWAFIDRLGIPFLGYDPTIILLTAVHFHYAGFMLPMTAHWLHRVSPKSILRLLNLGIILGIPLVAVGISATHFQWPGWIEVVCVSIMASSGALLGILYFRYGFSLKSMFGKISFTLGGLALFTGMTLAFCYGWRHVFLIETLTIPWMYAIHGTCNALGFAVPITLGWYFNKTTDSSPKPSSTYS